MNSLLQLVMSMQSGKAIPVICGATGMTSSVRITSIKPESGSENITQWIVGTATDDGFPCGQMYVKAQ